MKDYKIFCNPQGTYEAVKQGWSWPGFFFNMIWAFVKGMWGLGLGLFAVFFVIGFVGAAAGPDAEQAFSAMTNLINLVVAIVFGINGNQWRENRLRSRGYDYSGTVSADSPESAVARLIADRPTGVVTA